ncbi:MAG: hypothetical protein JXB45_12320 [Candidatus Krumholzibacteriota bacterium]|nr:hypothetical protein [Candidatus Krumholzibacteriota bacterium]
MVASELVHILRKVRTQKPKTIRSALNVIEKALRDIYQFESCVLAIPLKRTLYVTRGIEGISRENLSRALSLRGNQPYRWFFLSPGEQVGDPGGKPVSLQVTQIPIYDERERIGFVALVRGSERALPREGIAVPALSEVLSSILLPFLSMSHRLTPESDAETLRIELLEASRDEMMMREVLLRMLEISGGEFCAYYTEADEGYTHIMLDSRELSIRVPDIRKKMKTAYRMFTNLDARTNICHEKVYYRSRDKNLAYLVGSSKIESYFLIPVIFDVKVRGVLFFGSVREDAFIRENIALFRNMAEEQEGRTPLVYRLGGETEILEKILGTLPYGGAMVSSGGAITVVNDQFARILNIEESIPDRIEEIEKVSPFDLRGIWEEFSILGKDVIDRELRGKEDPGTCLSVTWVRLEGLAEDSASLLMISDISERKRLEREQESILAITAHEFRIPLTALKNSLRIMLDRPSGMKEDGDGFPAGKTFSTGRFLETALRTVDRLGVMVDGLVDASSIRAGEEAIDTGRHDIRSFIEEASHLFLHSMRKKGIRFSVNVDPGTPPLVFDRKLMEQVIQNLLSNSLKHVTGGGSISIKVASGDEFPGGSAADILREHIPSVKFVDIEINDTGGGYSAEIIKTVNNSFADSGMKAAKGLGLFIAERLMRKQYGKMVVESPVTGGSTSHLYLPADEGSRGILATLRTVEKTAVKMISRGLNIRLYVFTKSGWGCWLEFVEGWKTQPVVNPQPEETDRPGIYFWPLEGQSALAISSLDKSLPALAFMRKGKGGLRLLSGGLEDHVKAGWANCPLEGKDFIGLLKISLEKSKLEEKQMVWKGEGG